jgi:hypothetical protein
VIETEEEEEKLEEAEWKSVLERNEVRKSSERKKEVS